MIEPLHETPGGRCSDLLLDRHLAGELDDSRADSLEQHLAHSGPCRARYDALAAAHSRALGRMSQDIADAIRTLDRAAP